MTTSPDKRPYLGDVKVVEKLLLELARETVNCRAACAKGFITEQDANAIEEKEIERRAWIFLNRDKRYAPNPEWNRPGGIDTALAREFATASQAKGPENIVKAALGAFCSEMRSQLNLAEKPDLTEAQWRPEIAGIVHRYAPVFAGTTMVQLSATQADVQPAIEPIKPASSPAVSAKTETPAVEVNRPYLGDPGVVESILLALAKEAVSCRQAQAKGVITEQDANTIEEKEIEKRAWIFLGRDKAFAPDSKWNSPGVIDGFLVSTLELQEKRPEPAVKAALAHYLANIHYRVAQLSGSADWQTQIGDLLIAYRDLFLGLTPQPVAPAEPQGEATPVESVQKPEEATSAPLPSWIPPEDVAAPKAVENISTPSKAKQERKSAPVVAASQAPAVEASPRSTRRYALAALLICLVGITAAVFYFASIKPSAKREASAPNPETVAEAQPKPQPKKQAPLYGLDDGALHVIEGGELKEENIVLKTVPGERIRYVFDSNRASGSTRLLVSSRTDDSFRPAVGFPKARNLWLLDNQGNERQVHPSVFRARISPDGKRIVYTTSDCLLIAETIEGEPLATVTGAHEPFWRNDSKSIVFERVPEGMGIYPPEALQLARLDCEANTFEVLTYGRYDDEMPSYHPSGEWILFVSGRATGLPSFWKVPAGGGEPVQLTNVRLNELSDQIVPVPHDKMLWSPDGRWFLYDVKFGSIEQTWGIEFNDVGEVVRVLKLSDGLHPQWVDKQTFVSLKSAGQSVEPVLERLPES